MYMHFNHMMDQLQTSYNQLEVARKEAEAASIAKSDFLANMSHEIRTPMNAIIGLTDLMISQEIPAKVRDNLQIVKTSSEWLLRIINDILDFSKIEAGMLHMEQVEFRLLDVLEPLIDLFGEACGQKQLELFIRVDAVVPAFLVGDPLRLRQVLINLVSNAVKFTAQGDIIIRVSCKTQEQSAICLLFSVQDSGVGIKPDQIETLFAAFTQADSSYSRRYGGTGLGLAICRQLVKMMGGAIEAQSLPGKGSAFSFTALFEPAQTGGKASDSQPPAELPGATVLLIDDNPNAREIFSELLSTHLGVQVTTAPSAREGFSQLMQAAVAKPFQLVIIDRMLNNEDGAATAEQWHHRPELADLLILVIGGGGNEGELSPAQQLAIAGHIKKPVKNSLLVDTVRGLFSGKGDREIKQPPVLYSENHSHPSLENLRILVVEDNVINQQVARQLLESAGIGVTIAENGRLALALLAERANVFDGILMDIQMPDMDGYEVTGMIRKQEQFKDLPIIAMTAHGTEDDRRKSLSAGMDAHLTKPIRLADLLSTLDRVLLADGKKKRIEFSPPVALVQNQKMAADFPETMPGIDIQRGLQTLSGNQALYKRLLVIFSHDYADAASRISALLQQGNLPEAAALIHTVKGVSGNLAAEDLYQAACALETAVKGEGMDFSAQLDIFSNRHTELLHTIQDAFLIDENDGYCPTKSATDISRVKADLQRISELIRLNDTDVEEYLDSINLETYCPETQELFRHLRSQVSQFDFPGAGKTLATIAEKLKDSL
jgi:two-component system sensor histidine kinase/response regulator